ncbi:MAG: DUF3300 domain-containing protein [Candidatus Sumerlaeota bacterium]|nr:DUF3300 domain-containing protein [Candidatus Sumerlaeota bacterium]
MRATICIKGVLVISLLLIPFGPVFAQDAGVAAQPQQQPLPMQTNYSASAPSDATPQTDTASTNEQLDKLLGPIALYPDTLIAQMLPASTYPLDVVQAWQWVQAKNDPDKVGDMPWDASIKALVKFPDVLKMMSDKIDWTTQLGQAFLAQPENVLNAVQSLRAQAQTAGSLKDTPQQKVVVQNDTIQIVPADPQVIYVPQYNPQVVYVPQYNPEPTVVYADPGYSGGSYYYPPPSNAASNIISFGAGVAVGAWAANEIDWHHDSININVNNNNWWNIHNNDWYNRPDWWWHGNNRPVVYNNNNLNINNIDKNVWNQFNKTDQDVIKNHFNQLGPTQQANIANQVKGLDSKQQVQALSQLKNPDFNQKPADASQPTRWQHDSTRPGSITTAQAGKSDPYRGKTPQASTMPSGGGAQRPATAGGAQMPATSGNIARPGGQTSPGGTVSMGGQKFNVSQTGARISPAAPTAQTRPMNSQQIQQSLQNKPSPYSSRPAPTSGQYGGTGTAQRQSFTGTASPSSYSRPSTSNAFQGYSNTRQTAQDSNRGQSSRATMPQQQSFNSSYSRPSMPSRPSTSMSGPSAPSMSRPSAPSGGGRGGRR